MRNYHNMAALEGITVYAMAREMYYAKLEKHMHCPQLTEDLDNERANETTTDYIEHEAGERPGTSAEAHPRDRRATRRD